MDLDDESIEYFVNFAEHSEAFIGYDLLSEYVDEEARAGTRFLNASKERVPVRRKHSALLKQMVKYERLLRDLEWNHTEQQLWDKPEYHQTLAKMWDVRQEIDALTKKYYLPTIDLDLLLEQIIGSHPFKRNNNER